MATADKLITVAENVPKVYHSGQLNIVKNAECLKGTKSDTAMLLDDVSPVTHEMGVKIRGKNLLDIQNPLSTAKDPIITYNSITATKDLTNATYQVFLVAGDYTISFIKSSYASLTITDSSGNVIYNIGSPSNVNYTFLLLSNDTLKFKIGFGRFVESGITSITVSNIQLELGTTSTAYTPYIPDLTAVKVSRYGKNLLNLQGRTDAQPTGNWPISKYDVGHVIYRGFAYTGYYQKDEEHKCDVNVDGNIITVIQKVNNYGIGYLVKCRPNTQYTFNASTNSYMAFVFINAKGEKITYGYNKRFTTPENAEYIIICLYQNTSGTFTIENPQLEIGTTATDYEPYKECAEYTPTADGTVNGVTSLYPNTTLMTDTDGVIIDCEYYKDVDKAFDELTTSVALSGGDS